MESVKPETFKAAVIIDSWKRKIFKKALDDAGFKYSQHDGIAKGTLMLKVTTDDISKLTPVVQKAQDEAVRSKMH